MERKLSVAKAARMLDINRAELQKLIRRGVLQADEGQVDLEALRQLYPRLVLQESAVLERTRLIKMTAFSRRVSSTVMPDVGDLENRLQKRNAELALERALAKKYRGIIEQLCCKLDVMKGSDNRHEAAFARDINTWLYVQLKT